MNHVAKLLLSLMGALFAFFIQFKSQGQIVEPIVLSTMVALVLLAYFYGETRAFSKLNQESIMGASIGGFIFIGIAYFMYPFIKEQVPSSVGTGIFIVLGIIGIQIGGKHFRLPHNPNSDKPVLANATANGAFPIRIDSQSSPHDKILDTSVVIDGRILDIADTHFIDGPLILPNFVLREIQLISDSSDPIKRARGRRGLDMLNKLQRKGNIEVKISYKDYADTREVDAKLIKLARDTGAKLVTNDFNLNKVAELQGVEVLNLNNLANALKPVVLPGEELSIHVIKEGKDENQGIGYMDDGTMVVIENGGHLVNKDVKVTVTSIIQTAAGKMIFTKTSR